MRGLLDLLAVLALAGVALAFGRWLRDPAPGGPLIALVAAALVCAVALRRLYRPGGPARPPERAPDPAFAPRDERLDLNTAGAAELQRVPGIGPVGAERIVAERERNGPFRSPGDLVRVAGFGPSRVRALQSRIRAG